MDLVQKMGYVCAFDTRYTEEGCSKETADVISLQCAQRESDFLSVLFCLCVFVSYCAYERKYTEASSRVQSREGRWGRLDMSSEEGILVRDRAQNGENNQIKRVRNVSVTAQMKG